MCLGVSNLSAIAAVITISRPGCFIKQTAVPGAGIHQVAVREKEERERSWSYGRRRWRRRQRHLVDATFHDVLVAGGEAHVFHLDDLRRAQLPAVVEAPAPDHRLGAVPAHVQPRPLHVGDGVPATR